MRAPLNAALSSGWAALPLAARQRLALASTGWRHLALAGADCLRAARREDGAARARLLALAAEILLWAFGENPLHGPLAAEILSAADLPLPAPSRAALAAVAAGWRAPAVEAGGLAQFERLAARRDTARLAGFLADRISREPQALFWREKALALALFAGEGEPELREALNASALSGLERAPSLAPVAALLRAQAAFLRGDASACLHELEGLPPVFGPGFAPARAGLALLEAGDAEAALPHLHRALRAAPWQASLGLAAADALFGQRDRLAPPPGPALVLLYTWNKAADLDATLESLFASNLSLADGSRAQVIVLDNGSTDATPGVLDAWEQRAGAGLARIGLPVNIGAPAARNWLAALPEAKAAETLVYLDDDVALPPDWLQRLGAALAAFPAAGVVGASVADHGSPRLLQNAAGHLAIPEDAPEDRPDLDFASLTPNPFRLLDAHLQGPDWGLFAHAGPCASVTGCCHLFPRAALDRAAGGGAPFSLALGPSQYDDFERDLRMLGAGLSAVHTGHLRVRHRKRSGVSAQGAQGAEGANAQGNRYKMQCLHPRAEIAGFLAAQEARQEARVQAALALLDAALPDL